MALRSVIKQKLPVVIVVGATGVGKTKLSLSLAQKFNTEIISADSMQIYKCLNIVTAMATPEERALVPHHLLDILEPHQCFTVVDFRNRALKIINKLLEQNKIPIVVGGTNYYLESIVYQILVESMDDTDKLLWDTSRKRVLDDTSGQTSCSAKKLSSELETNPAASHIEKEGLTKDKNDEPRDKSLPDDSKDVVGEITKAKELNEEIVTELNELTKNETKYTNEEIYDKLKSIDQKMADRLHPNNRRKVLRAIEVYIKTGRRQSDLLAEQRSLEGQLRWEDCTIMLWLTCDQKVLDDRLNSRVDQMLEEGLIEELLEFHDKHNKQRILDGQPTDYTKGVFQTMGFKEFHEYMMLSPEAKESEGGKKLLEVSIENMKMATRRYARRQNKMIKGRFLEHPNRQVPAVYELDTTDLTKWKDTVEEKAMKIIESFIKGVPSIYVPLTSDKAEGKKTIDAHSRNYCETCDRVIIGDRTYEIHLGSIKHKKVLKKRGLLDGDPSKAK